MTSLDVHASVEIVDGRVTMAADGEATLYFETPEHEPLSADQIHATLRVAGDDAAAEIALDGEALDLLAIAALRECDAEGRIQ